MTGPTARRRRLGAELVSLRESAGLDQQAAAETLGCSRGKIINIEKGRSSVRKAELLALLDLYEADEDARGVLEELRHAGAQRGWWATYGLPNWVRPFVGFEADAATVRNFEPSAIPGLLQTEDYARAIHQAARHTVSAESIDKLVAARMERQRRLTSKPPLELWAIIDEGAVRREVGGRDAMREQIRHLIKMAELPNVKIQILPATAGEHPSMSGPLCILGFPDAGDPEIGWLDNPLGGSIVDAPNDVRVLAMLFDDIRHMALNNDESLSWLHGTLGETDD